MIFRAIDSSGDWLLGKGKQNYFIENNAIIANIRTRLLSFLNNCFFALNDGLDWFSLLGQKDRDIILVSIKKCILASYGVTRINSVDFYTDNKQNSIIEYNIDTIYTANQNGKETLNV